MTRRAHQRLSWRLERALLALLICAPLPFAYAQQTGEAVRIQGTISEDVYAAGATVDVHARVHGDVIVAGGRVTVSDHVTGDVMAAGGAVAVRGDVDDDVRLAGGDVSVEGAVGGDAIAAGGNVTLGSGASVKGRAWLAGARVEVAGTVGKELRATGERIIVSGRVNGDVSLSAGTVQILDGAVIAGHLHYRSPRQAAIASGVQILGGVDYVPVKHPAGTVLAWALGAGVIAVIGLLLTGGALYLLFPEFTYTTIATIRAEPWKCLGLGLAVFAATPVLAGALSFTLVAWLPALVLGALYLLLLLTGFLTGVFYVGDLVAARGGGASKARRLWWYALALVVVVLLGLLPIAGPLLVFVLMLLGIGALDLGVYRAYSKHRNA